MCQLSRLHRGAGEGATNQDRGVINTTLMAWGWTEAPLKLMYNEFGTVVAQSGPEGLLQALRARTERIAQPAG